MKYSVLSLSLLFLLCSFGSLNTNKTQIKWVTDAKGKKLRKEEESLYNDKGDIIKSVQYVDHQKPLCEIFSFEYANGHKSKKVKTFCEGKGYQLTVYTYDKQNRLVQEVDYESKNQLVEKRVNTYQGSGNNISSTAYFNGKEKDAYMKSGFEYYHDNLLKKEIQTVGGSWNCTNNYKYDSNKNLIYEDAEVDGGVGVVKYYYTYQNNILVKDVVKIPDTGTEYHLYEYSTKQ
ncbi:hypothetical protein [Mucilaginibacter endophyticus]|uniref:hypothetical protein n=1 Tax=Mucilaginibacter endophyticus TaxID=2675003 RepID=UPI000E0D23E2|nr:hypothetical protein [Mucilaginibacter endophyticus]